MDVDPFLITFQASHSASAFGWGHLCIVRSVIIGLSRGTGVDGRGGAVLGASLFGGAVIGGPSQVPDVNHDRKEDEAGDDLSEDVLDEEVAPVQDVVIEVDADGPDEASKAGSRGDWSGNEDAVSSIGTLISSQAGSFSDGTEHPNPDNQVEETKKEGEGAMKADADVSGGMGEGVFKDPAEVDNVEVGVVIFAAVGAIMDGLVGFLGGTTNKPKVEQGLAGDVNGC